MGRRQNKTKFKENLYFFIFCIERVEFGNNSLIFFLLNTRKEMLVKPIYPILMQNS